MSKAREGTVNVNSLSFKFLYRFLSKLIHYTRDYKFLSNIFLEILCEDDNKITREEEKVMRADLPLQGESLSIIYDKFYKMMSDSFVLADFLFIFKYQFIIESKKRKEFKMQKEKFKNHYRGHEGSALRLA